MGKLKLFLLIVCIFVPSLLFGAKKTETIKAKSMTWPGRAYQVRSALKKEKGILKVNTDTHKKTITVTFDDEKINIEKINKIIIKVLK